MKNINYALSNANSVVYGICDGKKIPLGVLSSNGELHATYKSEVSGSFKRMLVAIEDRRFFKHKGIDFRGILRAIYVNIKSLSIRQGASTLTQQLARNLLRDNNRTFFRKTKEIALAIKIEKSFLKDDILELYFNNVYWGKNIYGLRTASLMYFGKEPYDLTKKQKLSLITLLRGPNLYATNEKLYRKRFNKLVAVLEDSRILTFKSQRGGVIIPEKFDKGISLSVFKSGMLPYIKYETDLQTATIYSSLDVPLQKFIEQQIRKVKYPTSIVCIYKGEVIGAGSYYGSDYPFNFKSNVGSCLKPFVYSFLLENGFSSDSQISTRTNLNDPIREVSIVQNDTLSLKQALILSNNNVFVNACRRIGIDLTIDYLKGLLGKENESLFASSILGATKSGISLYELTQLYHDFFKSSQNIFKNEVLTVLKENLEIKTGRVLNTGYLKTGTTNNNAERFAIFGNDIFTVGMLRQQYYENDFTKEGNFNSYVVDFLDSVLAQKPDWL